jgi:hypothetical protein
VPKHARTLLIGVALAILLYPAIAAGAGEGEPLDGGTRNPSINPALEYNRETEIIADNSTYGTRQSNKSNSGGGAIYGCRSLPGGTPANNEPCIRSNNLNTGLAFEMKTDGLLGGTIVTKPGDASKPFTTNATGVATGLNADRVDGKHAADIANEAVAATQMLTPFALVRSDGVALEVRGVDANGVSRSAAGNYDVRFTGDLSKCALSATVTGAAPAFITATPVVAADKKTTTVDVRTYEADGDADDRGFHLHAAC